jgi:hypothetical protein
VRESREHGWAYHIKLPMLLAVVHENLVEWAVAAIRNHAFDIFQGVVRIPHLARVTDDDRH